MKKIITLLMLLCTCIGAWADSLSAILAVSNNETTPEYQYKVQPRNSSDYWWSSTTTTCNNIDNAGKFAFYAAEGDGNYYIYSVDAQQWLSYEKAASYNNGKNFVTLVAEKASANYFKAVKGVSTGSGASNDKSGYTFSPYKSDNTVAPTYLNWFEGAGRQEQTDKVGVYGTQWSDAGSVWVLIPADDATKTKSVELWRAEIASYNNIVGLGYSSADYESTASLAFDDILSWKANHSVIAFDPTKLYRVWNNSQIQGCSWTIGNNGASVAWAARDNNDNTQVWKFVQVDAENEYKYIIQNYGTPTAFMPNYLQGNSFHNHSVAKDAGKYAITASNNGFYQIHYGSNTGQYAFADGNNHLDGWQGDGKDKWYLEVVDKGDYTVINGNTETLSSILTTHENVGNIIVEEGATLNIDGDMTGFNMARITTCPGANVLVSNATADIAMLLGHTNVSINLENYSLTGNKQTVATGQLTVGSGKKLTIGGGDGQTNSVSSFTSVMVDGGTIYHNNVKETLHNVTLNAGTLHSFDMGVPGNSASEGTFTNAWTLEGNTTVTGNSYILSNYNAQYDIKKLVGDGTLKFRGNGINNEGASEPTYYAIGDVEEFTGAFDILNTNARFTNVIEGIKVTNGIKVNTISLKDITLVGTERINTQGNITIDGIVANNITSSSYGYALVQAGNTTLNLKGNIDFTQNSNGETTTHSKLGYQTASTINILKDANVKCSGMWWSANTNCAPINISSNATLVTTNNIWTNSIENNGNIKIDVNSLGNNTYINTATITGENFNVVLTDAALNALANGDYTVVACSGENAATNVTVNGESEFTIGSNHYTVAKDGNNIKLTKSFDEIADLIFKVDNAMAAISDDKVGYPDRNNSVNNDAITALMQYATVNPTLGSPISQDNYDEALAAYNAVLALDAVNLPVDGKAYKLNFLHNNTAKTKRYIKYDANGLGLTTEAGEAATILFTEVDATNHKYIMTLSDGNLLTWRGDGNEGFKVDGATAKGYSTMVANQGNNDDWNLCWFANQGTDEAQLGTIKMSSPRHANNAANSCWVISNDGAWAKANEASFFALNGATSALQFEEVAGVTGETTGYADGIEKYTLYVKAQQYEPYIGEGLGKYTFNTNQTSGLMDAVKACTILAEERSVVNSIVINQPSVNKFYRFKASEKYMSSEAGGDNVRTMTTEGTTNKTIFYLADDAKLIAYADGLGFNYGYCKAAVGAANIFDFSEGATLGSYNIHSNAGTGDTQWSDRNIIVNGDKLSQGTGGAWTIEPVETLPIKVNQVGGAGAFYGTINLPVAVTLPAGLKAYSAVASGDVLTLTKVAGEDAAETLAANTPVILYAESDVTSLTFAAEGASADRNELRGTVAAVGVEAEANYVLSGKDGVGFYKYNNTVMPGFKAYLPATATANANKLSFRFDDVLTAIEAVENPGSTTEIYDLQGRRLQKAQQGMNIINGHKVLVK